MQKRIIVTTLKNRDKSSAQQTIFLCPPQKAKELEYPKYPFPEEIEEIKMDRNRFLLSLATIEEKEIKDEDSLQIVQKRP
ncbi:MAG: hypothetical protein WC511_01990 [Candidatus Pacearchaeota archaeon]